MLERRLDEKRGFDTFLDSRSDEVRRKLGVALLVSVGVVTGGAGLGACTTGVTLSDCVMRLLIFALFALLLATGMVGLVGGALGVDVLPVVGEKSSSSCRFADKNGS